MMYPPSLTYGLTHPLTYSHTPPRTPLCTYQCKAPSRKSGWKKLAGPKTNILDIVTRTRAEQRPAARGAAKPREEDLKTRRRRLYRLATDEKPSFPLQYRNFYGHVMENKEVVKTLSLLSTCTQDMKQVRRWWWFL